MSKQISEQTAKGKERICDISNQWISKLSISNRNYGTCTVKILLEAFALIDAHPPVWTPKMPGFFSSKFHQKSSL